VPINYQPLTEKLAGAGARTSCVICGHDTWASFGPSQTELALVPTSDEHDKWVDGRAMRFAGWVCSTCGFLRLHSLDILELRDGTGGAG
jgi:hypothetical protein